MDKNFSYEVEVESDWLHGERITTLTFFLRQSSRMVIVYFVLLLSVNSYIDCV